MKPLIAGLLGLICVPPLAGARLTLRGVTGREGRSGPSRQFAVDFTVRR